GGLAPGARLQAAVLVTASSRSRYRAVLRRQLGDSRVGRTMGLSLGAALRYSARRAARRAARMALGPRRDRRRAGPGLAAVAPRRRRARRRLYLVPLLLEPGARQRAGLQPRRARRGL